MNGWRIRAVLVVSLLVLARPAFGQPFLPPPAPPLAPLLHLRLSGPPGARITIYRGFDAGKSFDLPCVLGFRPGYAYRFALSDMPGLPRQIFYPALEVRGTLAMMPNMRHADFPAHVHFSADDFRRVLAGSFIKKVIVLERPDEAIPVASKADEPFEILARDAISEGHERGQPLATLQMGQRELTPPELNALATPGTVLLPGERLLGAPRRPPYFGWNFCPVHDPVYGPKHPGEYMTLWDGGDSGGPAGLGRDRTLRGLDPTDTIAQYNDSKGNPRIAVSNRVGLCVPRFLVFKSETTLATQQTRLALGGAVTTHTPTTMNGQVSIQEQSQLKQVDGVGTRLTLSGAFNTMGTEVVGKSLGLDIKTSLRITESVDAIAARPLRSEPGDGPLLIIKWPDRKGAVIGDVVTFYLKYTNTGGQPITDLVVSDSLTARFEYVKGSTRSDREATFTMQPNEVGSQILRWELGGALQPRETGIISFQVRIR